jgi:ribonuclease E
MISAAEPAEGEPELAARGEAESEAAEAGEAPGDAERRRRRRGRRGGRRNRHGRDGEAFAAAEGPGAVAIEPSPQTDETAAEPEPSFERRQAEIARASDQADRDAPLPALAPAPVTEPVAEEAAIAPPASEPAPRRGSTVRERAPGYLGGHAAPPASVVRVEPELPVVPTATESGTAESEDEARPRRSGWWSKRVLGKG